MKLKRHKTKTVKIGDISIGGMHPIAIQSMVKAKSADIERVTQKINDLERAGCEIVRLAVRDKEDARALRRIRQGTKLPLVADIHFDWRLAIEAMDSGVDKIRLNPGNIYKKAEIKEIVFAAKRNRIPIRVGVNSGSLRKLTTHGLRLATIASRMVESALDYIKILEGFNFYNIVVSLKASNVFDTIAAYRTMAKRSRYPLHLGVTAAGPQRSGITKSSIALGVLLSEGIGDTIRVSLTAPAEDEVGVARSILESLGLRQFGPQIISCPTCGRCEVDLAKIVNTLENSLSRYCVQQSNSQTIKPLRVAVMGCVVNGPGEAREADIGVAFGKKDGLLFAHGRPINKVSFSDCAKILVEEYKKHSS